MAEIKEMINHPKHYNIVGRKECTDEMIDRMVNKWGRGAVSMWCEINAYAYEYQAGQKETDTAEQDYKKREWYLNKAKELKDFQSEIIKNIRIIADYYGFDKQSNQTIEECGELIQALAKLNRTKGDGYDTPVTKYEAMNKVIEELADVQICINQLVYLIGREYEINEITSAKLNRQLERIKNRADKSEEY